MRQKPMLFNSDMVNAILDSRKTQFRKVIKLMEGNHTGCNLKWVGEKVEEYGAGGVWLDVKCPYGKVGDQLWVRETFKVLESNGCWLDYMYADEEDYDILQKSLGWKTISSARMLKGYSRIQLEITDIRVERLNDISEGDAKAEGTEYISSCPYCCPNCPTYKQYFESLWCKTFGKNILDKTPWEQNPWVWVVEFKRVEL